AGRLWLRLLGRGGGRGFRRAGWLCRWFGGRFGGFRRRGWLRFLLPTAGNRQRKEEQDEKNGQSAHREYSFSSSAPGATSKPLPNQLYCRAKEAVRPAIWSAPAMM